MELGIRANRMERVSNSDFSALESLGPIRKAWAQLGVDDNPYGLTAAEREAGDALRTAWKNRQWGVPPNS